MTFYPPAGESRKRYIWGFVGLGLVAIILTVAQSVRAADAQQRATERTLAAQAEARASTEYLKGQISSLAYIAARPSAGAEQNQLAAVLEKIAGRAMSTPNEPIPTSPRKRTLRLAAEILAMVAELQATLPDAEMGDLNQQKEQDHYNREGAATLAKAFGTRILEARNTLREHRIQDSKLDELIDTMTNFGTTGIFEAVALQLEAIAPRLR